MDNNNNDGQPKKPAIEFAGDPACEPLSDMKFIAKDPDVPLGKRDDGTNDEELFGNLITESDLVFRTKKIPTLEELKKYNDRPYLRDTPPNKIKKRPDGFSYVAGSYMDSQFKELFPLYEFYNVEVTDVPQWGIVRVSLILRDRFSGNTQPGVGAARVQISREAKKKPLSDITPFDLVDYDKNVKSALTNAIKNAQSRFGIASDVYRKRELEPSEFEVARYEELYQRAPATQKILIAEAWKELGDGFTDFLDAVEIKLDKLEKKAKVIEALSNRPDGEKVKSVL